MQVNLGKGGRGNEERCSRSSASKGSNLQIRPLTRTSFCFLFPIPVCRSGVVCEREDRHQGKERLTKVTAWRIEIAGNEKLSSQQHRVNRRGNLSRHVATQSSTVDQATMPLQFLDHIDSFKNEMGGPGY
jgi:hypothetical protein